MNNFNAPSTSYTLRSCLFELFYAIRNWLSVPSNFCAQLPFKVVSNFWMPFLASDDSSHNIVHKNHYVLSLLQAPCLNDLRLTSESSQSTYSIRIMNVKLSWNKHENDCLRKFQICLSNGLCMIPLKRLSVIEKFDSANTHWKWPKFFTIHTYKPLLGETSSC